jgi:hypothetical protein
MIREHKFVVDDAVVEFFAGRTKRERESSADFREPGRFRVPEGRMAAKDELGPGITSEAVWPLAGSVLAG